MDVQFIGRELVVVGCVRLFVASYHHVLDASP